MEKASPLPPHHPSTAGFTLALSHPPHSPPFWVCRILTILSSPSLSLPLFISLMCGWLILPHFSPWWDGWTWIILHMPVWFFWLGQTVRVGWWWFVTVCTYDMIFTSMAASTPHTRIFAALFVFAFCTHARTRLFCPLPPPPPHTHTIHAVWHILYFVCALVLGILLRRVRARTPHTCAVSSLPLYLLHLHLLCLSALLPSLASLFPFHHAWAG